MRIPRALNEGEIVGLVAMAGVNWSFGAGLVLATGRPLFLLPFILLGAICAGWLILDARWYRAITT
jgi:hypothetical protein